MCCRWNVYQSTLIPGNLPCPKQFLVASLYVFTALSTAQLLFNFISNIVIWGKSNDFSLKLVATMFFISSKKLFLFLRYSNFCNFFPSFPHFPNKRGQMEVEWFMMSWIGLHKFADVTFDITQKLLYITLSNLDR